MLQSPNNSNRREFSSCYNNVFLSTLIQKCKIRIGHSLYRFQNKLKQSKSKFSINLSPSVRLELNLKTNLVYFSDIPTAIFFIWLLKPEELSYATHISGCNNINSLIFIHVREFDRFICESFTTGNSMICSSPWIRLKLVSRCTLNSQ